MHNNGYAESGTASIYGRETVYNAQMQHFSPAPSLYGGIGGGMGTGMGMGMPGMGYPPPPGYQSGRNTPQSQMRLANDTGLMYHPTGSVYNPTPSLHQPTPSRPTTNYLDMSVPMTGSPDALGGPSDAELERAVQEVLTGADLNSITKREIRRQLEERFGMDLTARKSTINAAIDRVLLSNA